MATHKQLAIWLEAINLVEMVYTLTSNYSKEHLFVLTNPMMKSAISIPSNIAEGAARQNKKEFIYFLRISLASLSELETQFIISSKLGFVQPQSFEEPIESLRRKMLKFLSYVKSNKFR